METDTQYYENFATVWRVGWRKRCVLA